MAWLKSVLKCDHFEGYFWESVKWVVEWFQWFLNQKRPIFRGYVWALQHLHQTCYPFAHN